MSRAMLIISISLLFIFRIIPQEKPVLSLTFDDGNPDSILGYSNTEWSQMILDQLNEHGLKAALFVYGKNLDNERGKRIIESWNNSGHIISNHTYSHFYYNSEKMTFEKYKNDFLRCDSIINDYANFRKYFRAPYLKRGNTEAKRDSLIRFLKGMEYKNGYVTIDASDWYYNSELIKYMKDNPGKSIEAYKKAYIEHLLDRARYYDELAYNVLGRKIKHTLLLHHNLTSALFLGDLIKAFQNEGWEIIDAEDAFADEIYSKDMNTIPAGESIVWSLAKETGKYEDILRYPAEDSRYEEDKLKGIVQEQEQVKE